MANACCNTEKNSKNGRESAEDSDEESENLEESPCGRWVKRREEVQQRDIPGIDVAYLAMDTEEGVEVVWNEVLFSERKNFRNQEGKICGVFDSLTQLEHPNIVKLHKYWIDKESEKPRVIFITEYMSSGSLKQFLKKTKRNVIKLPIQAWKRWCTQILSALSYLHSCSPPIIHGNLTCNTIFIQHNGLIKIGSVAPEAIHHHVKTCQEDLKNMHFFAPEYGSKTFSMVTPAVDIYAFGMCALEMAALEITGNGESTNHVTEQVVNKTINSLEDPLQKDFIRKCLQKNPILRPMARQLLFHPVIFEVHSLKLLCAHVIVKTALYQPDQLTDEALRTKYSIQSDILAYVPNKAGKPGPLILRTSAKKLEVEKFLDDVRNGIYPLTAYASTHLPIVRQKTDSPETGDTKKPNSPEAYELETRRIINIMCNIKPQENKEQAGFRQLRSPNQLVAFLIQSIKDALGKSKILSAVFIDLKSAYDTVWAGKLLLKLADPGHVIKEADSFSYLGVTFDQKLSWRAHTENIVNPVSNTMTLLIRLAGSSAGAGKYCHLFSFYSTCGKFKTTFDGEVAAFQVALAQLHCHLNSFIRAVVFCDSKVAVFAVNSNSPPASSSILDCKKLLQSLSEYSKQIVLQWMPEYCIVTGNEFGDYLAKKRASIQHIIRKAVPFTSARHIIKKKLNDLSSRRYAERNSNKMWWNNLRDLPMWPRCKAVAEFRLTTAHDCLLKHLHRVHVEDMDAVHIRHCPALKGSSLCDLYWQARNLLGS
ncbi:nuclear receptor-binding protein [Trichonephila clavipes]|nr:nuclear receptor-binding protein [Trichonephila clavipes]